MRRIDTRRLPQVREHFMAFAGGLNQSMPAWEASPGLLRDAENFEIAIEGGYQPIQGYERFDGQASPSDASYDTLNVTITGSISVDDTITGATSGATAVVVAVVTDVGDDDYLVITKITGTFEAGGETLNVSGSPEATTSEGSVTDGAPTNKLHAQYLHLAAGAYRSDVAAVPGSGNVLGIWMLNDVKYAFRNNAGGTAADVYKSTSSGWTQVALGRELSFTGGGTTEPAEGDTITGLTSGATATLTRIVLESGSWSGGDAAGRFIFASQTGTFQAENIEIESSGTDDATISGDSDAITLLPDGRFEFWNSNFGGSTPVRMYGCDGVNRGFEFDGSVFVPIETGISNDAPTHVVVHKQHLFFSFLGSLQHSSIGDPYQWSVVTGAGEIATGDTITGMIPETGSAGNATLIIYNQNHAHALYGNSSADWNLVSYRREVGAFEHTIQQIAGTLFFSERGLTNLSTTQSFGNFVSATLTQHVQEFINGKKTLAQASCIVREKNQYRLFFSDGTGMYVTLGGPEGGIRGIMPVNFDHPAMCAFSLEASDGSEEMMFGSDNGMVYQMDKGTSFDGATIDGFFMTQFDHQGYIRWSKTYKDAMFEAKGDGYAEFYVDHAVSYGNAARVQLDEGDALEANLTNESRWDGGGRWDTLYWDGGKTLVDSFKKLGATGQNISLHVRWASTYFHPIRLSGAMIRYVLRRRVRDE